MKRTRGKADSEATEERWASTNVVLWRTLWHWKIRLLFTKPRSEWTPKEVQEWEKYQKRREEDRVAMQALVKESPDLFSEEDRKYWLKEAVET